MDNKKLTYFLLGLSFFYLIQFLFNSKNYEDMIINGVFVVIHIIILCSIVIINHIPSGEGLN